MRVLFTPNRIGERNNMTIDKLLNIAVQKGIKIFDTPMQELRAVALSGGWIAIDRRKCASDTEYKCVLAHEIGHCETDSFYTVHTSVPVKELNERQANRFAADLLVPFSKLLHAIHERGMSIVRTLAIAFDVTIEFMQMVLDLYEQELASPSYRRITWVNALYTTVYCAPSIIQSASTAGSS